MAELASPESWCTGNGTVGSNPTPSAAWGGPEGASAVVAARAAASPDQKAPTVRRQPGGSGLKPSRAIAGSAPPRSRCRRSRCTRPCPRSIRRCRRRRRSRDGTRRSRRYPRRDRVAFQHDGLGTVEPGLQRPVVHPSRVHREPPPLRGGYRCRFLGRRWPRCGRRSSRSHMKIDPPTAMSRSQRVLIAGSFDPYVS